MLRWHNWETVDRLMMFVSLGVIAFMLAALPWGRRVWQRPQPRLPVPQRTPATA